MVWVADYQTDLGSLVMRMALTVEQPSLIPVSILNEYQERKKGGCSQKGISRKRAIVLTTKLGEFKIEIPISSADLRWNEVIDFYRNHPDVLSFQVVGETLIHWYVDLLTS